MANVARQRSDIVILSVLNSTYCALIHAFKHSWFKLFMHKSTDHFIRQLIVILTLIISLSHVISNK